MQNDSTIHQPSWSRQPQPLHPNPNLAHYGCTITFEDRFWSKVKKTEGCWLWTAHLHHTGYGTIHSGNHGEDIRSHRASWIIHFGIIPDGQDVLHKCPGGSNRACINPAHLKLGGDDENQHDCIVEGRKPRGEQKQNRKLSWADVDLIRELNRNGVSRQELAARFGVSVPTLRKIVLNLKWRRIPVLEVDGQFRLL